MYAWSLLNQFSDWSPRSFADSEKFPRDKRSRKGYAFDRPLTIKRLIMCFITLQLLTITRAANLPNKSYSIHHSYSKTKLHDNSPWIWPLQTLGPRHSTNNMTLFCVKHYEESVIFSSRAYFTKMMERWIGAFARMRIIALSNLFIWHIFAFILRLIRNKCIVRFMPREEDSEKLRCGRYRTKRNYDYD